MQRGEYMKYKVQLFIGGSTIWFKTYATSNQEAEENARRVYPNATIIFTTATFWKKVPSDCPVRAMKKSDGMFMPLK